MGASQKRRAAGAEISTMLRETSRAGKLSDMMDLTNISQNAFDGILNGRSFASANQANLIREAFKALDLGNKPS